MLYTPIKRLSNLYNSLQDAVAAGERILYIFDQEASIVSKENASIKTVNTLSFEDVTLKYGEKSALNGIDFSISKGEKLALVGDSGGGKSSIVNLIMRFYNPNSGHILLDGQNIEDFLTGVPAKFHLHCDTEGVHL